MPQTGSISSCVGTSAGEAADEVARGALLDELGEDRDGDLLVRDLAQIQAGRRVHARELIVGRPPVAQVPEHGVRPLARGDETDVRGGVASAASSAASS
jgi:hypothetical protein